MPAENVIPSECAESGTPTRRGFFVAAIYAIWGLIGTALSIPAFIYLFFPPKARKEGEWVEAGDIARLAPDEPVEMVFRRNRADGWKVVSEKEHGLGSEAPG